MAAMQSKSFMRPDEIREFDKGVLELVNLGGVAFGRGTFQPGWKWSTSVKPLVQTASCEAPHLQYHIAGRLRVRTLRVRSQRACGCSSAPLHWARSRA